MYLLSYFRYKMLAPDLTSTSHLEFKLSFHAYLLVISPLTQMSTHIL